MLVSLHPLKAHQAKDARLIIIRHNLQEKDAGHRDQDAHAD